MSKHRELRPMRLPPPFWTDVVWLSVVAKRVLFQLLVALALALVLARVTQHEA